MYNNMYAYNPQITADRIDTQIAQLQQIKSQMQQPVQPPSINQTFQLASTQNGIKYANSINEVQKEMVLYDTPFFSKDMSIVWIKNAKNEIKTYELTEIVPRDEKDLQIEFLQSQIDELKKGMIIDEQFDTNDASTKDTTNSTRDDETIRKPIKKGKPTSL